MHIQRHVLVRPILLPGKTRLKRVEHLTEMNILRNVASSWLYSANGLTDSVWGHLARICERGDENFSFITGIFCLVGN